MTGRIQDREIILINLVTAFITACVAGVSAFGASGLLAVKSAALTLLFTTTYLWVAYNRITMVDGRGLGWFSLFVAITVVPVAVQDSLAATTLVELWLGVSWGIWAVLWFMYFLLLALGKSIQRGTAAVTLLTGVFTGWLPGVLLLLGLVS